MKPEVYDSIINKTPLSFRTNRIIGGVAPSLYLKKLETGNAQTPAIAPERLDGFLESHFIDPALIRADDFENFMISRQQMLLSLIEKATGKSAYLGTDSEEGDELEAQPDAAA